MHSSLQDASCKQGQSIRRCELAQVLFSYRDQLSLNQEMMRAIKFMKTCRPREYWDYEAHVVEWGNQVRLHGWSMLLFFYPGGWLLPNDGWIRVFGSLNVLSVLLIPTHLTAFFRMGIKYCCSKTCSGINVLITKFETCFEFGIFVTFFCQIISPFFRMTSNLWENWAGASTVRLELVQKFGTSCFVFFSWNL